MVHLKLSDNIHRKKGTAINIDSTRIVEITDLQSSAFHRCMELYETSFPPEERKSIPRIKTLLEQQVYRLYAVELVTQCIIIGFALIMFCDEPAFLFIDNIVIDNALRGKGLGSDLIRKLAVIQIPQSLGIFLEVEKPELAVDKEDQSIRTNRMNFYQRLGFIPLKDINYYFPVHSGDPLPLFLMFKPVPGVHHLTADTLKQMIKAIYYNIHSDVENSEDILQSFISNIKDQVLGGN